MSSTSTKITKRPTQGAMLGSASKPPRWGSTTGPNCQAEPDSEDPEHQRNDFTDEAAQYANQGRTQQNQQNENIGSGQSATLSWKGIQL